LGNTRPALDIQLPPTHDPNLIELLFARLDDFQPTALQEGDGGSLLAFFSSSGARDAALGAIVSGFASRGVSGRTVDADDEDWAARSQTELHAVEVGCIVVAPPWDVPTSVRAGITSIVIDPSMGFGTGHHESTRLCLNALQRIDLHGREVLDIGTGSGVLAITAVLLGANHAAAIDVDPDALQSARENAGRNGVESRITFQQADFRDARLSAADIVLANLTGAIVYKTFGRLVEFVAPAGALILSGFTHEELGARPDGFIATSPQVKMVDRLDEEGWRCFVLRRC
jgi:ribosomal protein L11 methyltransferase